ncbi:RNA recognition motif domain-containing protein [Gloeothece verrucosa]|uniref:RNP-1 like RNA-binding protein n=1 Tax=Gloeothece verrucosa (strain PCC 7822) TaxID=497965 RepID=E0UGH8_GLOV7|nr:RNA-binding protein [Gloeothece verrucosa]ADN12073.1 RNP-1 like RNA-binding protein [Gloeothece verrucosa PCC 7822]
MPVRLYVGNLPKEPIERQALQEMFAEAGDSITTKVIKDRKTGKCRGFAFVTVPTDEAADEFIEKYNGQPFMDSPIRVEKALPRSKGKGKEDGDQPQSSSEEGATTTVPAPAPTPKAKKSGGGGAKKRGRSQGGGGDQRNNESFQPDPRWAGELAKLKEMLAAQTSNS